MFLKNSDINLVKAIVIRDFKAAYSRTILGRWLAFLSPVVYLIVFIFFRLMFKLPTDEKIPLIPFLFSGISIWIFFATTLGGIYPSINANMGILRKIPVNPFTFVISSVANPLLTMIVYLILLICMCLFYNISPTLSWICLIPIIFLVLLFSISIGIGLCALGIYRRDIIMLLPIVLQLGMFITPIFFPPSIVPESLQWVVHINPMALYVSMFRDALFLGEFPSIEYLSIGIVTTTLCFFLSYPLFRRTMRYATDSI